MNYHVIVTENGTEKIIIIDSYSQPVTESQIPPVVTAHLTATDNPHQTSLQQTITKQGNTPVNGQIQFGANTFNEETLTILKSAIYMVLNGHLRSSSFDVNGFYHTTNDGLSLFMDNGGVRLFNGVDTITIGYDGTITGLQNSQLAHSAVTKSYVDTLALGLMPHAPVKVMLEKGTDVNTFIANGSGVGKTLTAVQNGAFQYQGISFSIGDRIGLKCFGYQRLDAGIYVITHMGDTNSPWVLTRATDFDGNPATETKQADVLFVQEGTYAKYMFIETERGNEPNSGNLIIDSDLVTWEIFHKPQDFVYDQGLQLNGQIVSVKPDNTTGDTIIPITVSPNGVGVQKSIITDIADAKKLEAKTYSDSLKTQSDQALQTTYQQTQTNDQTVQTSAKTYTDIAVQGNVTYVNQQIAALAATIPSSTSSKPYLYPQFFILNGQTLQNYDDYLFMDNAYRSGNDNGLNSNSCIPFFMPHNGTLIGITAFIGYVAAAGNYVPNTMMNVNFELRQISLTGYSKVLAFSMPTTGTSDKVGSNGTFPANPVQIAAETAGLSVNLYAQCMYGIKFIHNTANSPSNAGAIKNVVIKLEIRVG